VAEDPTRRRPVRAKPRPRDLRPWLVFVSGTERAPVQLSERSTVLGRGETDVSIDVDGVSREHAKLVVGGDGTVSVLDLNSTNGTYVNGERIELAALREGDELQLGPDLVLHFTHYPPQVNAADAAAAQRERKRLTARELEVARHVARGSSNAEIAEKLGISLRTVTSHLDHIYTRLEINSRAALASWVMQSGLGADDE
jgi:DNA-binding CsgD family transcriptional regulator